jgi:hypothetical protein
MGTITVLNKDVCNDPDAFYIGRGSPLGNPFTVAQYGREMAILQYEEWLDQQIKNEDPAILEALDEIMNQVINTGHADLKCFCKPKACHGDVIRALVLKTIAEMGL